MQKNTGKSPFLVKNGSGTLTITIQFVKEKYAAYIKSRKKTKFLPGQALQACKLPKKRQVEQHKN
jgi:hypothetical protein